MTTLPPSLRPTAVASLTPPPVLVPPINFALVAPGVYRSGHPNRRNFGFLQRLGLKTVLHGEGEASVTCPSLRESVAEHAVSMMCMPVRQAGQAGARRTYVARSDEYRPDGADFVSQHNLNLHHIDLSDDEELFTPSGKKRMYEALQIVLDTRNYPILVHDDTGKAAVTLLCALARCYQNWALTAVFREGDMFAGAGGSDDSGLGNAGKEFIATFDPRSVPLDPEYLPDWAEM
ncbi:cytoplasm protein [Trichosporon asahii var. asahii CBS 2479]|uniref:Cytoplasm protein n=1 Tax=Trichosporon asahii var. asahii (strain ATCC 90039 / CBS 2479 / JCM 2466 / KCTC 7840 / NBRC 103889/ NCYC 2677 / UAMH 7654) TaxID=1186058 RepID=J5T630_TRIAS|nr:cytoplasm protein [Trichosporon asahii var. asahii CBS 2479]EJT49371.1 cytoplasm protein [Trichosporon asahii var. asahii CBS 2479]